MEPADDVDLGSPLRQSLLRPPPDFRQVIGVGPGLVPAPGKGAESAAINTDVGMVEMTVDVEEDPLAILPLVHQGRQFPDRQEVGMFKEKERLKVGDPFTGAYFLGNLLKSQNHGSSLFTRARHAVPLRFTIHVSCPPTV